MHYPFMMSHFQNQRSNQFLGEGKDHYTQNIYPRASFDVHGILFCFFVFKMGKQSIMQFHSWKDCTAWNIAVCKGWSLHRTLAPPVKKSWAESPQNTHRFTTFVLSWVSILCIISIISILCFSMHFIWSGCFHTFCFDTLKMLIWEILLYNECTLDTHLAYTPCLLWNSDFGKEALPLCESPALLFWFIHSDSLLHMFGLLSDWATFHTEFFKNWNSSLWQVFKGLLHAFSPLLIMIVFYFPWWPNHPDTIRSGKHNAPQPHDLCCKYHFLLFLC